MISNGQRKPVFGVSDHVRNKRDCTATEDGKRLEISDLGNGEGLYYVCSENKGAAYAKSRFSHDAANIVVKHAGDYALVISAAVLGQALFFSDGGCTKFFPVKSVKLVHFLMLSSGT